MFTYEFYETFLRDLKNRGYNFSFFNDKTKKEPTVYLRHDIDLDIFGVSKISEIEHSVGAKSVWYIMPDNEIYNMMNRTVRKIMEDVSKNGHQIGLHIDATYYNSVEEMLEFVEKSFVFFGDYLPLSRTLSFHRPAKWLLQGVILPGFVNAYESEFYSKILYISDSNRRRFWEQDRIREALCENKNFQLVTHPIWWKDEELSRDQLNSYLANICCEQLVSKEFWNCQTGVKRCNAKGI